MAQHNAYAVAARQFEASLDEAVGQLRNEWIGDDE